VGGLAVERDTYAPTDVPQFAYTYTTPGVFIQDDIDIRPWLAVSVSGRVDHHSEYGTFFSPRVSALLRSGDWSTRISTGSGFFGPSVLTEETEAAGLSRVQVAGPLQAERGRSVSIDLTRTHGALSYTATFFGSRIAHPIKVDRNTYVLRNLVEPTTNVGVELLGLLRQSPLAITASYTYVRSRETERGATQDVELTPRHSIGLVGMWENEDGRVGVEWYYTGQQRLEDNPYREQSESYNIVGVLVERRVGRFRLFVNGENLTDTRQTQWDDPFLRPERAADGRWTVDAWGPLDGRVINGGVRIGF
jgi:outer membrane receptor protein involved in Fe transport